MSPRSTSFLIIGGIGNAKITPGALLRAWARRKQGLSHERNYVWVVLCKNHRFHNWHNVFFGHKIPLGETDAVEDPPALKTEFSVRCDECSKEYSYKPKELLRVEMELPDSFTPHPLFQ